MTALQAAHHAVEDGAHGEQFVDRRDHRQQDADWAMHPGPQDGGELGLEDFRPLQGQADGPQAERRIEALGQPQGGDRLLATGIQGADGQGVSVEALHQIGEYGILLVLVGQVVAVHVDELAAQQADPGGPRGQHAGDLDGELDIGLQADLGAVQGDRRYLAEPLQLAALAQELGAALAVGDQGVGPRVEDHLALGAVEDDGNPGLGPDQDAGHADHRRQAERAGHDGGMAGGAAQHRGEAGDIGRIEQRGVGRAQLLGQDHRVLRQHRERPIGGLGQIAHQPAADLANVFDAGRQIGVVHGGEPLDDLVDLALHRGFGVDSVLADAVLDAAHQPRAIEHLLIGFQQIAQLLAGRSGHVLGLVLQLGDLSLRRRHRFGEAPPLAVHLLAQDPIFRHGDMGGVVPMGDADGDPRTDAEAVIDAFLIAGGDGDDGRIVRHLIHRPFPLPRQGLFIFLGRSSPALADASFSPRQISLRSARPGLAPPRRRHCRGLSIRWCSPVRRPASSAP